jgi:hypothetical protein
LKLSDTSKTASGDLPLAVSFYGVVIGPAAAIGLSAAHVFAARAIASHKHQADADLAEQAWPTRDHVEMTESDKVEAAGMKDAVRRVCCPASRRCHARRMVAR